MTVEFETWYRNEYPRLVNTIALVTGDRNVATEAASEACIRALAKWDRVRAMDQPGGWVYKVALNDARRRLKKASRERKLIESEAPNEPTITLPVEPDHELWAAVKGLPERTRDVVILRYVADLTEPAIAEALGIRRGTVATMLRRAHQRLHVELQRSPSDYNGEYQHAFH